MTANPYGGKKAHPLADAFPMMDDLAYAELVKDIKEHGLQEHIVIHEGMILDGRNRKKACQELGIACPEIKYPGNDAPAYVWSKNAVRRQLDGPALTLAAARLATATAGMNQWTNEVPPHGGTMKTVKQTVKETAGLTKVPVRQIEKAKRVIRDAVPEVTDAYSKGEITLEVANRLAAHPKAEQKKIISMDPKDVAKAVPNPRYTGDAVVLTPDFQAPGDKTARKGVGRGHVGPQYLMAEQIKRSSSAGEKTRLALWTENRKEIRKLDPGLLTEFVKDMSANRRYITQLLKIIKEETENKGS